MKAGSHQCRRYAFGADLKAVAAQDLRPAVKHRLTAVSGFIFLVGGSAPALSAGEEGLLEGFEFTCRLQTYARRQQLTADGADPDNLLGLYKTEIGAEIRPDLFLVREPAQLRFLPRYKISERRTKYPEKRRKKSNVNEFYIHEWEARLDAAPPLSIAIGREDLQWGPAIGWSPSNPFGWGHGRYDPREEAPAADFAQASLAAGGGWTISAIANLAEGRRRYLDDFERVAAIKADYIHAAGYGSLILAKRRGDAPRFGAFGGYPLGDAFQLHTETGLDRQEAAILGGATYTTGFGWAISAEFLHNSAGNRHSAPETIISQRLGIEADSISNIRDTGTDDERTAIRRWLADRNIADNLEERPLRQNYLLLQLVYADWMSDTGFFSHYTLNIDDGSGRLLTLVERHCLERTTIFAALTGFHGNSRSEFGSLLDYRVNIGFEMSF